MTTRTQKHTFSSILIAFALTTLGAAPALAQAAGGAPGVEHRRGHGRHHGRLSPEHMERRLEHLTSALSLDEHQVVLLREIFDAARTEAEALRGTERGEGRREARHALIESVVQRIDAVLNDAQRETFARLRTERHAQGCASGSTSRGAFGSRRRARGRVRRRVSWLGGGNAGAARRCTGCHQ